MTPTEAQKLWASAVVVSLFLLTIAVASGAITASPAGEGYQIGVRDSSGALRASLSLSLHQLPNVTIYGAPGSGFWESEAR